MRLFSFLVLIFFSVSTLFAQKEDPIKAEVVKYGDSCYNLIGQNVDLAIKMGEKAVAIATKHNRPLLIAQAKNDLSIPYLYRGDYKPALKLNLEALEERRKAKDTLGCIASLAKIGSCQNELGNPEEGLKALIEAMQLAEAIGQLSYAGQIANDIGSVYRDQGLWAETEKYFSTAVSFAEQLKDTSALVRAKGNYAFVYRHKKQLDSAEILYKALLAYPNKYIPSEVRANLHQNLGVLYAISKDQSKRKQQYLLAEKYYEQANSIRGLADIYKNLANIFAETELYDSALIYYRKSLSAAKIIDSKRLLQKANDGLADYYQKTQTWDSALFYRNLAIAWNDSFINEDLNAQLAEMETKYETEKKERLLSEEREKNAAEKLKSQKLTLTLIALGSLLFMALIAFFFYSRQQKVKAQLKEEQNALELARLENKAQADLLTQRKEIARELHDNIGSYMTVILIQLEAIKEHIPKAVGDLHSYTQMAMRELRNTVWLINKNLLYPEELLDRITDQIIQPAKNTGIDIAIKSDVNDQLKLKTDVALNLYRIMQEATNNAIKYASESSINVEMRNTENQLTIEIRDTGAGITPSDQKYSHGLINMRDRAAKCGATYQLTSDPNGTTVHLIYTV